MNESHTLATLPKLWTSLIPFSNSPGSQESLLRFLKAEYLGASTTRNGCGFHLIIIKKLARLRKEIEYPLICEGDLHSRVSIPLRLHPLLASS